ncbi:translation initiation factor eIF-2B subunit beta, putative [Plasmodium berghei]|uniref:Translation initiation factor eIF2B subunit beta n=2 Tax=Plasmodium berghei TaxID=5821 RepID=A0A509ASM2_PLABA|nr:translation initiation factor eIF-2B subunit beta, putative [Plasmodium berghei ANKA]CXJ29656.1 translation initiation factor eIF-2B subunit beta, putative [Plasmodium berghei]SCM27090.1 translation initiation factor eIF-2B subunit beta, putative [Plasmodium berghei]SCN28816.1 translation initiation factor eIF-2B subunit beta, putative [Plasmodium berghei]SCO63118.1 translation initiation factor eIF-2B subunit beta, putative [Plasmodium berghei]SCO64563.1 translation initiation factor eIF-2|eukprot:XP_034424462.1 translation initiation factor eIF-2B subunit beta, putative [Plasmodium berghei ANKA]
MISQDTDIKNNSYYQNDDKQKNKMKEAHANNNILDKNENKLYAPNNNIHNLSKNNDNIINNITNEKKNMNNNLENNKSTNEIQLNNNYNKCYKDEYIEQNKKMHTNKYDSKDISLHNQNICNTNFKENEIIKFEKKQKKSEKLKKNRQKEIISAYWLKGIADILNEGFKNGYIKGSNIIGKKIADVLKKVVEIYHWESVYELIEIIKYLGKEIIKNNKMIFIIPNIIRRVLTIIRTEHFKQLYLYNNNYIDIMNKNNNMIIDELTNKTVNNNFLYERELLNFEKSLSSYFENSSKRNTYKISATNTLKHSIIEGITELIAEIDLSWGETEQRTSYDLFMENDVILTMGYSFGVEKFLKNINKKKEGISIIVVGGDINRNGFKMAKLLSEDGVDTTYIPDSAIYAVIPKVTKVVIGSVAVSSSGGAITKIGGYNIACSAFFYSKPVIVVLPLFKLLYDPLYDPLRQNELQPGPPMIYDNTENLYIRISKYDYIPQKYINLYITEIGPIDSFQLYNIAKKKYHPDDIDLSFD